jgi:TRAP-type mannitol/chloroaromatic compound transport system permease small subunit
MNKLITLIDTINDKLGKGIAWLALVMVLVMGLIVVLRYAFQIGSIALQESVIYLNALIFTFGAAYTLKEQGHVRVDVFYNRASPKLQAIIDLAGTAVFLTLTAGFIVWASWDYVAIAWRIREGSAESSGLPFVFLLKTALLALPILLLLQGLAQGLKAVSQIVGGSEVETSSPFKAD